MEDSKPGAEISQYLAALLIVAQHYNPNFSKEDLLATLPNMQPNLDYPQFVRAASLINLSAKLSKATIAKLYALTLPTILIMKNEQVYILHKIEKKIAIITRATSADKKEKISVNDLKKNYTGYCFVLTPSFKKSDDETIKPRKKRKRGNWLWRVVINQLPTYSEVLMASFLVNTFALASPLFIMNVYDKVIPNQAFETLWTLALAVGLVLVFDFILRELRTYFIDISSRNVDTWFTATLFEQLLEIKMDKRPPSTGVLVNSMQSFDAVKEFLSSTTIVTLVDFPFSIIFLIIIYFLGGWLVLIPLIIIPFVLLVSYLNYSHLTDVVTKLVQLNSRKQAILIETLQNIPAVKLSLSEGTMQTRWEALTDTISKLSVKNRFYTNMSVNISVFSQYFASIAIVVAGVYRITSGTMRMGELIACTILTGRALVPVTGIATIFSRYKQAKASYELINSILELPIERPDDKHFLSMQEFKGNIEFRNVSFSYPGQKTKQIDDVSFQIKPGDHLGLIGLNGSGKSTILKLIMKLYEPKSGHILIDGVDSNQLDPADLRRFMGYVPQEVNLFQGSIKDNIKLGIFGIDDQSLLKAAEMSGLSQMVREHPEGFERDVGERGQALSGGERQVIGLTRALLHNPPLLILDEPTNLMDENATTHFVKIIQNLGQHKNVILVTHKLDLLKLVNRIIVMYRGKVVADGNRDEVLKKLVPGKDNHG